MEREEGFLAEIVKIQGKTGVHGEIYQCLVKVLEGKDAGRVLLRNIKGPVWEGMKILLKETEREAKEISAK